MAAPIFYPANRVEEGTLTVTGEATAGLKENLRDRNIRRAYQDSAPTGNRDWVVDLGVGVTKPVDTWAVPPGHNFGGVLLEFATSADAVVFTTQESFTPAGGSTAVILRKQGAVFNTRAYRLRAVSPSQAPKFHELWFSRSLTLPFGPTEGEGGVGEQMNLSRLESSSGFVAVQKLGPSRWRAEYLIRDLLDAPDRDGLVSMIRTDLAGGAKPCFLTDHEGLHRYVELQVDELFFTFVPIFRNDLVLRVRAVLTALDT